MPDGYHTRLVEYRHRCACGQCLDVITNSPELEHDQDRELEHAKQVLLLHLALSGRELPVHHQPPPQP